MKYTVKETIEGIEYIEAITDDGVIMFIPKDEANSEYQRYLNPQAEHLNGILPADE